jgi:hypothetical protein
MNMTDNDEYMLTTIDNPWNPYTHWDEWQAYDIRHGHNTSGFLARVVSFSFDLSETDQDLAIKQAIDEIVKENVSGIFKKISPDEVPSPKMLTGGGVS